MGYSPQGRKELDTAEQFHFHFQVRIQKTPSTLVQKDTCTPVFMAAFLTIAKIENQTKGPSTDEQAVYKKTTDYCLVSHKKNEVLSFGTTWMDLEGIMLSEIRQKDKYYMLPLTCSLSK